ncbi:isochorismatase family protein [Paraburkholderia phenazinium]|jgi:isochorismate hydrolase|uniref:Isochorismate hydrolase n=1 Tax=Paraburkholderia phenazinium TaxID=60549 RepID=A0A1G8JG31_9BURK|nr:isochorismatase family protein [Paraburkholderia phenazinium]SDI30102.1 Isochorismate hydrolase [Paraburkholderia phenazinium]
MAGIPIIDPYHLPQRSDVCANIAGWRPDPKRAVLLVHDMQPFFLRPLPGDALAQPLVEKVESLVSGARALGVPIAYTAQPGGMTVEQRGLLKDFWGPGMAVDPVDREIPGDLAPRSGDWVFTKWRYSAFFKTDLLSKFRETGRDQLVICGVYAHIGILATAIEAYSNDIETFIVADAVADFTRESHLMALNYAAQACAVVAFTEEVWR